MNSADVLDFKNPDSSEGWRVYMFHIISDFVFNNPITGSGFIGSWILFYDYSGSAHNQYLDVFLELVS